MREEQRVHMQNLQEHKSIEGLAAIKGNSPSVRSVMDMIRLVAPLRVSTLISGKVELGKSLLLGQFTMSLHKESPFWQSIVWPFSLICSSRSFGHEKGALQGPMPKKVYVHKRERVHYFWMKSEIYRFVYSPNYCVFLSKRHFVLWFNPTIPFQARVICATHVHMRNAVKEGRFERICISYQCTRDFCATLTRAKR